MLATVGTGAIIGAGAGTTTGQEEPDEKPPGAGIVIQFLDQYTVIFRGNDRNVWQACNRLYPGGPPRCGVRGGVTFPHKMTVPEGRTEYCLYSAFARDQEHNILIEKTNPHFTDDCWRSDRE